MAKPTEAEMNEWFKEIDVDGSGKIDSRELRTVVKAFYDWQKVKADDAMIDADVAVRRFTYFKRKLHKLSRYLDAYGVSEFLFCCIFSCEKRENGEIRFDRRKKTQYS